MGLLDRFREGIKDFDRREAERRKSLDEAGILLFHDTEGHMDLYITPPHGIPAVQIEAVGGAAPDASEMEK